MISWPITSLHQIELTSNCNLRCVYCPSPHLGRPKVDMDRATFDRALEWVRFYRDAGTQGELNLAGIGESTLHPDLVDYVALARRALGWKNRITFATNGLLMTEDLAKQLAPFKPEIYVSAHRPEKAGPAVQVLESVGLLAGVSFDPTVNAVNWAGQVNWFVSSDAKGQACAWRIKGWCFVLADGRISSCCYDADGSGVFGHVRDEPGSLRGQEYRLCATCQYNIHSEDPRGLSAAR